MLPVWTRLRVARPDKKRYSLGFPVILVWILIAVLMLLLLPFILPAALVTWRRGTGRILLLAYPLVWTVLWNLSGLHIETNSSGNDVLVDFR